MEELQAEFTRALLAMNQLGHFAQGNLHTVCSNTSHDCCIAILPDKRFMQHLPAEQDGGGWLACDG